MAATGEQLHQAGVDGVRRAKHWLAATCRANVFWDNPANCAKKLQYSKASASPGVRHQGDAFSFDLGGIILGGDSHGREFLAEVKFYSAPGDQGVEYRRFLAKCYRAEVVSAEQPRDHYLWISWAPFLVQRWPELTSESFVREALAFDEKCEAIALAGAEPIEAKVKQVAEKIVIIILSERQELLLSLDPAEAARVRSRLMGDPTMTGGGP